LNYQAGECPQSDRPDSLFAILRSNLKGNAPLLKENSIRGSETVPGIVDMSGLGRDSVQFNYLKIFSLFEIGERGRANIKATEIEAGETAGEAIDSGFQRLSLNLVAIEENTSKTMRADFNQLDWFIFSGDAPEPIPLCLKIDTSHADSSIILED
jgi:hypothetical protein